MIWRNDIINSKCKGDFRHLIFKADWEQLMQHQHAPSFNIQVKPNAFEDTLIEKGSYLHLVHQFCD